MSKIDELKEFLECFELLCKNRKSYPLMQTDIDNLRERIQSVIEEREKDAFKYVCLHINTDDLDERDNEDIEDYFKDWQKEHGGKL